ncbi:hypothetical protein Lal_00025808 [Lupinus albus]|nr:hypothetical protein Lal_00025808 [Lupinus albus]
MVIQTPITHKRTPRGVTSMKNIIRARRKNVKLTVEWNTRGQPCNNKGGNTLTTFDVGEQHKDYIIKTIGKALRQFRTDAGKCLRDANGNVNLKPPAKYANLIDEADWMEKHQ